MELLPFIFETLEFWLLNVNVQLKFPLGMCGFFFLHSVLRCPLFLSSSCLPWKQLRPILLQYSTRPVFGCVSCWRWRLQSPVTKSVTWSRVREHGHNSIIASWLIQHELLCFSKQACPSHPNNIPHPKTRKWMHRFSWASKQIMVVLNVCMCFIYNSLNNVLLWNT